MKKLRIKVFVYKALESSDESNFASTLVEWFILVLILLSVVSVILETVSNLEAPMGQVFRWFEVFSITVFTAEYLLRIWSCTTNPKYSHPVWGRIRYAFSFMALIDFVAIIPFYIPFIIPLDLRFIRAIRVMRMFRLLKVGRYSNAVTESIKVLHSRKEHLIITLTMIMILLVLISGVMYVVEHEAQPEGFSNIPNTMWWAVCTMTTVGYGDVYPVTPLGKFFAGIISLLGVGLFAVPAGIISSGFYDVMQQEKTDEKQCPNCGHKLDDN